jgi:hypothetical protein
MTEVVRSREQTLKQQVQQLRQENESADKLTNLITKKGRVVHWQHLLETAKRARNSTQMPPGGEGGAGKQDNQEK